MRNYTDGSDRYMPYDNTYGQSNNVYASQDRNPSGRSRASSRNNSSKKRKTKKGSDVSLKNFFSKGPIDSYLFLLIIFLTAIGLVMILSSSYYTAIERRGTGYFYFNRQFIWSIIGIIAMLVVSKINYNVIKKVAFPSYIVSLGLLLLVFIIGIGTKGATRWLEIGSINFQPSEIAKIGLISALALLLSRRKDYSEYALPKGAGWIAKAWHANFGMYAKEWALILVPVVLIISENWSTAAVVLATGVIMLSISGFRLERWSILGIIFIVAAVFAIKGGAIDYLQELNIADGKYNRRLQRFETWIDPFEDPLDTGFQTVQSLYAIGSGGITGVGLGKSKQKLGYLPESHNDMIFTIVCEEFGLIGALVLLGLFMALIIKCCQIALKAPDRFAMYFTMGMITLIALQVIINVGVVTGVIPNTGMPLPFISYGGTSLVFTMIGMGVVLNISRYITK